MISSTELLVHNMEQLSGTTMDIVVFDNVTIFGIPVSEISVSCEDLVDTASVFFEYATEEAVTAAEKQIVPFCSHRQIKAVITDVLYTLYSTEYNSPVRRLLRAIGA